MWTTVSFAVANGSAAKSVVTRLGEDLGFEEANGRLFAIYGSHRNELSDKSARYYWNYRGK